MSHNTLLNIAALLDFALLSVITKLGWDLCDNYVMICWLLFKDYIKRTRVLAKKKKNMSNLKSVFLSGVNSYWYNSYISKHLEDTTITTLFGYYDKTPLNIFEYCSIVLVRGWTNKSANNSNSGLNRLIIVWSCIEDRNTVLPKDIPSLKHLFFSGTSVSTGKRHEGILGKINSPKCFLRG